MDKFTLLMNGKDHDTGIYKYFPYTDKVILNSRRIKEILVDLNKGKIPSDLDEYICGQYCCSQTEDYSKSIEYAHKAFQVFKKFSLKAKVKIFHDLYKKLNEKKEEFIQILIKEGHPRKLSEWEFEGMKTGSSPETIDYYFSQIRKEVNRYGSEIVYWARRPDGVVCISPPGNASASNSYNAILVFLVGNTLIIKPPRKMPLSTIFLWKEIVWEVLKANGVPEGILNIVLGNSQMIVNTWVESPLVNDVIYFGGSKLGLEIGNRAYQFRKKPILELSGNDLFLVWRDSDLEAAANSLLDCFLGSTQICMVPKIAVIHHKVYDKFVSMFLEKVKSLKFGLPSDPKTIFSPVMKMQDFFAFLEDAVDKGAQVIHGGNRVDHQGQSCKNGLYLQPTLLRIDGVNKAKEMRCIQDEIFFPLLPLIKVSGSDEEVFEKMVDMVNSHNYGLRTSLWINSYKYLRKFAKNLDNCGLLRINTRHVGFSFRLSTHGGTKLSGGPFGEMNYFWHKTSHLQGISRILK